MGCPRANSALFSLAVVVLAGASGSASSSKLDLMNAGRSGLSDGSRFEVLRASVSDAGSRGERQGAGGNLPRTLEETPVDVGGQAFNEFRNSGFSADRLVRWRAENLSITSSGRFSARVTTFYHGPLQESEATRDVLFWNIVADFVFLPWGDYSTEPLSETQAVTPQEGSADRAVFALEGGFRVPSADLRNRHGRPLSRMTVQFTWVRIYKTSTGLRYHVLPADSGRRAALRTIAWNQPGQIAEGWMDYYAPIRENLVERRREPEGECCGLYDYPGWIREHIRWQ